MYYHYTNRCGAMAIHSTGFLQPSQQSGGFGPGVYLTDLDPHEFFRDEILMNNYGGIRSGFHNRADWVVEVTEDNIDMQLLLRVHVHGDANRRIFVYPYCICVSQYQIYDKPRCLKSFADATEDTSSETDDEQFETEDGSFETDDNFGSDDSDSGDEEQLRDECDEYESNEDIYDSYSSSNDDHEDGDYLDHSYECQCEDEYCES